MYGMAMCSSQYSIFLSLLQYLCNLDSSSSSYEEEENEENKEEVQGSI